MHRIAGWVAIEDLIESLVHSYPLAGGARRHVDQREDIQLVWVRLGELRQGISQAAFLGLEPRARVICDQGDDTRGRTLSCEPPRPVNWMETGIRNCPAISDVMKPRGHDDGVRDIEAAFLKLFG